MVLVLLCRKRALTSVSTEYSNSEDSLTEMLLFIAKTKLNIAKRKKNGHRVALQFHMFLKVKMTKYVQ